MLNEEFHPIYSDVDVLVTRIDEGTVTRRNLANTRSRLKREGKTQQVNAISEALRITKNPAGAATRRAARLDLAAPKLDFDSALELKASLMKYAGDNDFHASVVVAHQSMFDAMGLTISYDEAMAYILLNASNTFEQMTGELPVIVNGVE